MRFTGKLRGATSRRRVVRVAAALTVAAAGVQMAPWLGLTGGSFAPRVHSKPTDIVLLSAGSTTTPSSILQDEAAPEPASPMLAALEAVEPLPQISPTAPVMAQACDVTLELTEAAGAMIGVTLAAPCHAGERVVLRHAGLAVTGRLDAGGGLNMNLPALTTEAGLEVRFADGATVAGEVQVAAAATLRRFGVQWQGGEAFALHGFEDGADWGQLGHVSADHPAGQSGAALAVLGDASVDQPLLAQVFTYPAEGVPVEVVMEAAVTEANCGHDLLGEVLTVEAGHVETTDLTLAMPDCSGVGDFLVLKNLPAEMKLAAN